MTDTCEVLIVGAGAYGLSVAWSLAEEKPDARILVVDALDFGAGGTGRNGSGFRMQWGLKHNIALCKESIEFFEQAAERLDYPQGLDMRQEGYLLLAHDESVMDRFRSSQPLREAFGVPSEILRPEDCEKIVPGMRTEGIIGASFCPRDGNASPFRWLDALHTALGRLGVEVEFNRRVERLRAQAGVFHAETKQGTIEAQKVLICTDYAAPELLAQVGVTLPIQGVPKEVVVTEAVAQSFGAVVVNLATNLTLRQVNRGNFVITTTIPREPGDSLLSTNQALQVNAAATISLLPDLGDLRVIRSWGGVYSKTPGMQAILGETDQEGLYVAVSAYKGFMTAPAAGRLMAELILEGGSQDPLLQAFSPRKVLEGDLEIDPMLV